MSHGGGGGGFGHGGGMHHGGHQGHSLHHGGEPEMSASWNMAYVGDKRSGRLANLNPFPIFLGLIAFSVMILPFVMDWDEPHLQRLLIGHDLTPKEIAHRQAVDQMLAGAMRSRTKQAFGQELGAFGNELGGAVIQDPGPQSGSDLIAEPQAEMPALGGPESSAGLAGSLGGGLGAGLGSALGAGFGAAPAASSAGDGMGGGGGFMISADSPAQPAAQSYTPQTYAPQSYGQMGGLSNQMSPAQSYAPNYGQAPQPYAPPTVGFGNNQRLIGQPGADAFAHAAPTRASSGIDRHAPRHRVVVER